MKRSWCNLIQNVYRRSLSSGPERRKPKFSTTRDPQGLRRPRFSFFIFTCQTAWVRKPALILNERLSQSHPTTNNNRQLSAVYSLISMRNVAGRLVASAVGQSSAALSGCLIGPPDRTCQRPLSTNRRIESGNPATAKNPYFSKPRAPPEP
jgi:hypothetical protein